MRNGNTGLTVGRVVKAERSLLGDFVAVRLGDRIVMTEWDGRSPMPRRNDFVEVVVIEFGRHRSKHRPGPAELG